MDIERARRCDRRPRHRRADRRPASPAPAEIRSGGGGVALIHYLLVFVGGGLGAALRHGVNRLAFHLWGGAFPAGTLIVNVLGSLLIGLAVGIFAANPSVSQATRLFLTTGFLGGFTTFSTFSLDALILWERGNFGLWLLYVGCSVVLSLLAAAAGFLLSRSLS